MKTAEHLLHFTQTLDVSLFLRPDLRIHGCYIKASSCLYRGEIADLSERYSPTDPSSIQQVTLSFAFGISIIGCILSTRFRGNNYVFCYPIALLSVASYNQAALKWGWFLVYIRWSEKATQKQRTERCMPCCKYDTGRRTAKCPCSVGDPISQKYWDWKSDHKGRLSIVLPSTLLKRCLRICLPHYVDP